MKTIREFLLEAKEIKSGFSNVKFTETANGTIAMGDNGIIFVKIQFSEKDTHVLANTSITIVQRLFDKIDNTMRQKAVITILNLIKEFISRNSGTFKTVDIQTNALMSLELSDLYENIFKRLEKKIGKYTGKTKNTFSFEVI